MPGIGIIINPHSRSHRLDPTKAKRFGFIVGDKGSCHTTKDILQVEQLAKEFKDHKIDILGISGGDGTNHATLTTFLNVYGDEPLPKIALLRGGTMNNLANCLNIKGSPEVILSNLILRYHEDIPFKETEIDLLKVNNAYGFLFGMGLVSNFIEIYSKRDDPTPWWALRLVARTAFSALFHTQFALAMNERFDAKVTVDGETVPFKNYTIILAGTMEELGFRFRPLYRARQTPGKLQLIGISTTPRKFLSIFPSAFLGRPFKSEDCCDVVGSKVVIELDKPLNYTIDGDTPEVSNCIEISTGQRLRMIIE